MIFRFVGSFVWLMFWTNIIFAQQKLPTGVYQTVAKSSFKYIDKVGDTLYLDSAAVCTVADFVSAEMALGYSDRPVVSIILTEVGRTQFAKATKKNAGKKLAIIGNGRLLSAPVVQSEIAGGMFEIAGDFTVEEANSLVEHIRKDIKDGSPFSQFDKMAIKNELSHTVKMLDIAFLSNDVKWLDKLLHEDLSMGHSNGWIENKEEVLRHLNSGFLVYQAITPIGEIEISIIENFVRMRRKIKVKGIADKTKFELELSVLEVWLREYGEWKLWSRQSVGK